MGMWHTVSKEERTLLYKRITAIVDDALAEEGVKLSPEKKKRIVNSIFYVNKKFYNIHITQLASFLRIQ